MRYKFHNHPRPTGHLSSFDCRYRSQELTVAHAHAYFRYEYGGVFLEHAKVTICIGCYRRGAARKGSPRECDIRWMKQKCVVSIATCTRIQQRKYKSRHCFHCWPTTAVRVCQTACEFVSFLQWLANVFDSWSVAYTQAHYLKYVLRISQRITIVIIMFFNMRTHT